MATPPQGHPRPAWYNLLAAFQDHGILPDDTWREVRRKSLGSDYRRRVRACLLEIRDPLRQRWEDPRLRHLDHWSPPSHLSHSCRLCGECDTVSSAAKTGANRCARCAPGGRVPLSLTSRGPAQAHGGGGLAQAHRGGTRPLTRTPGPRGRIRCAPVARVRALTPNRRHPLQSPQYHPTPTGGWAGTRKGLPPSAGGDRPGPGSGRCGRGT